MEQLTAEQLEQAADRAARQLEGLQLDTLMREPVAHEVRKLAIRRLMVKPTVADATMLLLMWCHLQARLMGLSFLPDRAELRRWALDIPRRLELRRRATA